jgi:peptidoglycan/LPS O-acetylase OafA/YrhL
VTAGLAARTSHDRLEAGDGLRAAAALTVVVYHCAQTVARLKYGHSFTLAFGPTGARVIQLMNACVFTFFTLSGYLIARPFTRWLVLGSKRPRLGSYAAARLLRVVPAFWVAFTLTLLIEGTAGGTLGDIAAVYAFGQLYLISPVAGLISQAWTLDVELAFYALVPFAAAGGAWLVRRASSPRTRAALLLAALAVPTALSLASNIHANPLLGDTTPPQWLFAFTPGIALAIVEPLVAPRVGARLAPALVVLAVALYALVYVQPVAALGLRNLFGDLAAGAILAGAMVRHWVGAGSWWALDNPVMRWIGERSYGLYVFHMLVLSQLHSLAFRSASPWVSWFVLLAATLAISLVVASLSWRFVERPAIGLRKRLARRPAAAAGLAAESPA